jgi:hypothetical protein
MLATRSPQNMSAGGMVDFAPAWVAWAHPRTTRPVVKVCLPSGRFGWGMTGST